MKEKTTEELQSELIQLLEKRIEKLESEQQGKSLVMNCNHSKIEVNNQADYNRYFREPFIKRMGLKGLSYEELLEQLRNGTYGKHKGNARGGTSE